MRAQEQANLLTTSSNLELDDLSGMIQSQGLLLSKDEEPKLTQQQKINEAVRKELEFTQNVIDDYGGFSGITEMA